MNLATENGTQTILPIFNEICIYPDGRGEAWKQLQQNRATISERQRVLEQLLSFIQNHKNALAGMYWKVAYLDPKIELSHGFYRGSKGSPAQIAALWPNAEWRREKQKYSSEDSRDWLAEVDGITLRISRAEVVTPIPTTLPEDGPVPKRLLNPSVS